LYAVFVELYHFTVLQHFIARYLIARNLIGRMSEMATKQ